MAEELKVPDPEDNPALRICREGIEPIEDLFPGMARPPFSAYVRITPEMAHMLLQGDNRNFIQANLDKIVSSMKKNDFMFTGDTIKFYRSGKLFDGQHRLKAIIISGIPQVLLCVFNVPDGAQKYTDIGKMRMPRDFLSMRRDKVKYPSRIASALNIVKVYIDHHNNPDSRLTILGHHTALRTYEVDAFYDIFKEISVHFEKVRENRMTNATWAAALRLLFSRVDVQLASSFIEDVTFSVHLDRDSQAWKLNQWLHKRIEGELPVKQKTETGNMHRSRMLALSIKAFNHIRSGKNPGLIWNEAQEGFPKIKDLNIGYALPHGLSAMYPGDDDIVEME